MTSLSHELRGVPPEVFFDDDDYDDYKEIVELNDTIVKAFIYLSANKKKIDLEECFKKHDDWTNRVNKFGFSSYDTTESETTSGMYMRLITVQIKQNLKKYIQTVETELIRRNFKSSSTAAAGGGRRTKRRKTIKLKRRLQRERQRQSRK